jgi:PPOX class probable F420-dependent enzyme
MTSRSGTGSSQVTPSGGCRAGAAGSSDGGPRPDGSGRRRLRLSALSEALVAIRYIQVRTDDLRSKRPKACHARDSSPQASVIFVKPDGDDVLFSTIKGRRKTANMQRDPRVSLLVHSLPAAGGEITYAAISGTVELTDDPGGAFHQVMYDLHMGGATAPPEPGARRLIVRLRPDHVYAPPSYVVTADDQDRP